MIFFYKKSRKIKIKNNKNNLKIFEKIFKKIKEYFNICSIIKYTCKNV